MKMRSTLKLFSLFLAASVAGAGLASASSRIEQHIPQSAIGNGGPINSSFLNSEKGISRSTNRLAGQGDGMSRAVPSASFGSGFSDLSIFADYSFIHIDDERKGFPGGETNGFSLGMDWFTQSEVLVGLIYSYSEADLGGSAFSSTTDSNFLTAYISKSIQPWLQVGMTAGWGDTETDATGGAKTHTETQTWSFSPFATVVWANGPLFASGTLAYQYTKPGGNGQQSFTLETNVGYQLTDALSVVGLIRFFQMISSDLSNPDDDNYTTFGGKVHYALSDSMSVNAGIEFDAWNETYDTFSMLLGMSKSF